MKIARAVLAVASLALAATAAAAEAAKKTAAPEKKTAESVPVTPTEDLMREHGVLQRILLVYEAGARRISQGEEQPVRALLARSLLQDG